MKISQAVFWAAVTSLLAVSTAFAQQAPTSTTSGLRQPYSAKPVSFDYNSYYAQEEPASPSDAPAAPEEAPATAANGNGTASCSSCCASDCEAEDPFKLFDCCLLDRMGVTVAGWTAASYTWNPDDPADRFNGPITWTDRSNDFQLNQMNLYIERATDTKGSGWDIGGRIDLLFGTDFRFTTAAGLEDKWNREFRFYGLAMPQMYVEVAYNDLKVKMGHFYSPVGYFVVPTLSNFFNSLPYTFQYGEPFTHTGMLATYTMTDRVTVGSGFIRGWDNFDNFNPNLGYLGTATVTGNSEDSLAAVFVYSNEPSFSPLGDGFSSRYLQTLVYSRPLSDEWSWVVQSDLGVQGNATATGNVARWYGLNNYLYYKVSDSWTWGANFEWFRDEDGFRVGGFLAPLADGSLRGLSTARSGFAGNFYQVTVGPQWRPANNWLVRPNLRWDWYNGPANAGGLLPYDDGSDSNQFILGTDVVVTW